ncbi:MAG: hypothetical protein AAGI49_20180, partial [Bacteroidota bacterium]
MKSFLFTSIFSLFAILFVQAQNCDLLISEDKVIDDIHILRTEPQTLVVRGSYSYSITIRNERKGILATMTSKAGVEFNQDDEIIFMDANRVRKSYRFIGSSESDRSGEIPVFSNVLQLDMAAVKWLSGTSINTIYLKNNIDNQMRKFTVNANRQTEFKQMASCFIQKLDPNMVNDTEINA